MTRLDTAPVLLKDGYLAFYGCVVLNEGIQLPSVTQEVNFEGASSALATFRAVQEFPNSKDLSVYISLAMVIVAFAEWVTDSRVALICQRALTLAKPIYESQTHLEDHDLSSLSCLIFIETTECFFRGQIPTIRFRPRRGEVMDRYLGLSLPLLPHLYDLCELSNSMARAGDPHNPSILGALCRIEQQVDEWRPIPPHDFARHYSQTEGIHTLAQAQVLSLTILLIIHRLRFPFGVNNDKATILSKCILRELDNTRLVTQQVIPFSAFPFLIAAFEIINQDKQKILESMKPVLGHSKPFNERMLCFLKILWHLRDSHEGLCWYNLSKYLAPAPMTS